MKSLYFLIGHFCLSNDPECVDMTKRNDLVKMVATDVVIIVFIMFRKYHVL